METREPRQAASWPLTAGTWIRPRTSTRMPGAARQCGEPPVFLAICRRAAAGGRRHLLLPWRSVHLVEQLQQSCRLLFLEYVGRDHPGAAACCGQHLGSEPGGARRFGKNACRKFERPAHQHATIEYSAKHLCEYRAGQLRRHLQLLFVTTVPSGITVY